MTRKNLAYFDGRCAHLTLNDDYSDYEEIVTCDAHCDRYIRIYDGRQYPQLCAGGSRTGNTLIWAKEWGNIPEQFARDCDAKLYKTHAGYVKARAALRANEFA